MVLLEQHRLKRGASVFHDKMGEMTRPDVVNAVDDGTIAGKWGSVAIDDEGMPPHKKLNSLKMVS